MGCKECGKPKCNGECGCKSPKVLQINNPAEYITFHKVSIPAAMGDSITNPPKIGAYRNALVYYEADHTSWMYSTDGIPTLVTGEQGPQGLAGTVTVGTTTTGEPGSNASVKNVGTPENAILDFTVPQGPRVPEEEVQYDVDNKIDEMAKDGTLQALIVDFVIDKWINTASFLFNPQKSINEDMYVETKDVTPTSSKVYFLQVNQEINDNGYVPCTGLTKFEEGVTYYEHSSNYSSQSGECLVIKVNGKNIMIDTGASNRSDTIRAYLEENEVTKLDYLIITHYHSDHCTNLDSIKDYVDLSSCVCYLPLVAPVGSYDPQYNEELMSVINSLGLECIYPNEGDTLEIDDFKITFYNCGNSAFNEINAMYVSESDRKVNDYSMLCLANYYDTNVLYGGDIENAGERRLHLHNFFGDKTIDLYKWQHHGVNALKDMYEPFIKEVSPKEVVIVTGEVGIWGNFDVMYLRTLDYNFNYAWGETLKWTSNGSSLKKNKVNKTIFEYKNIALLGSSTPINSYTGFLKITNAWYYRSPSIIFRIADAESNCGECIGRVSWHVTGNTLDIDDVKIENISSSGSISMLDRLRVVVEDNEIYLYFKKDVYSIIPTFSLLDYSMPQPYTSFEAIYDNLNEADFTARFTNADVYSFKNLNDIKVESPFTISTGQRLVWKKKNGVVEIIGSIATTADIPVAAEQLIAYLPDDVAAEGAIQSIQQSNQLKKWTAQIVYDSKLQKWKLMLTRYGVTDFAICPKGAWLPIHIVFLAKN